MMLCQTEYDWVFRGAGGILKLLRLYDNMYKYIEQAYLSRKREKDSVAYRAT